MVLLCRLKNTITQGFFMEEMIAARYNAYWVLSFIFPAIIMLAATYERKKYILILGVLLSLTGTFTLCNLAVEKKWNDRLEMARTDVELDYATADGANLVFTLLVFAPFEAMLYTSFWGAIGWRYWPRIKSGYK